MEFELSDREIDDYGGDFTYDQKEYEYFAGEYWDFARWIHDYYKWEPSTPPSSFDGNNNDWDDIREGFVNNTDGDCADPPHCYIDIWDHSHSVKYKWDDATKELK